MEDEEAIRVLIDRFLAAGGPLASSPPATPPRRSSSRGGESPDLVLCDIAMPVMDGYGGARALQSDPATARCPVVFLTAQREFTERVRAFRFGVVDYMTKPFTRDLLLKKVERVLQGLARAAGVRAEGAVEALLAGRAAQRRGAASSP